MSSPSANLAGATSAKSSLTAGSLCLLSLSLLILCTPGSNAQATPAGSYDTGVYLSGVRVPQPDSRQVVVSYSRLILNFNINNLVEVIAVLNGTVYGSPPANNSEIMFEGPFPAVRMTYEWNVNCPGACDEMFFTGPLNCSMDPWNPDYGFQCCGQCDLLPNFFTGVFNYDIDSAADSLSITNYPLYNAGGVPFYSLASPPPEPTQPGCTFVPPAAGSKREYIPCKDTGTTTASTTAAVTTSTAATSTAATSTSVASTTAATTSSINSFSTTASTSNAVATSTATTSTTAATVAMTTVAASGGTSATTTFATTSVAAGSTSVANSLSAITSTLGSFTSTTGGNPPAVFNNPEANSEWPVTDEPFLSCDTWWFSYPTYYSLNGGAFWAQIIGWGTYDFFTLNGVPQVPKVLAAVNLANTKPKIQGFFDPQWVGCDDSTYFTNVDLDLVQTTIEAVTPPSGLSGASHYIVADDGTKLFQTDTITGINSNCPYGGFNTFDYGVGDACYLETAMDFYNCAYRNNGARSGTCTSIICNDVVYAPYFYNLGRTSDCALLTGTYVNYLAKESVEGEPQAIGPIPLWVQQGLTTNSTKAVSWMSDYNTQLYKDLELLRLQLGGHTAKFNLTEEQLHTWSKVVAKK